MSWTIKSGGDYVTLYAPPSDWPGAERIIGMQVTGGVVEAPIPHAESVWVHLSAADAWKLSIELASRAAAIRPDLPRRKRKRNTP